jgi:hypothetical protein
VNYSSLYVLEHLLTLHAGVILLVHLILNSNLGLKLSLKKKIWNGNNRKRNSKIGKIKLSLGQLLTFAQRRPKTSTHTWPNRPFFLLSAPKPIHPAAGGWIPHRQPLITRAAKTVEALFLTDAWVPLVGFTGRTHASSYPTGGPICRVRHQPHGRLASEQQNPQKSSAGVDWEFLCQ